MRFDHNRQARRAGRCFRAPSPGERRVSISARRLALAAEGDELARVAARIAAELELPAELIAELSAHPSAAVLTPR